MRILYLSCHEILEYDEIKLLRELGHYVFSPGAYVEPRNRGDNCLRPNIDMDYDPADVAAWKAIDAGDDNDRKSNIPRSFVERFDVVIVMHIPHWIYKNWDNLSARPVVWRTIGQSIDAREQELRQCRERGMKIVRYSPMEELIPCYIGGDAMIRFYKDPEEYKDWEGHVESVVTFNQSIKQRGQACNYDTWEQVTHPFPRVLYGPGNDGIAGAQGVCGFEVLKAAMRGHRCYMYVGTHPASYTLNFIEAWMTGIPIVSIGPKKGNADYFSGHKMFEIDKLITNGVNGFWSDEVDELRDYIRMLLADHEMAKVISANARADAIHHFGKPNILPQWDNFLRSL